MEEAKKKIKIVRWMDNLDSRVKTHGNKAFTLWQIAKYLVVCGIVFIIQLGLLYGIDALTYQWKAPLPGFIAVIFSEHIVGKGHSNWGYLLPFLLSNIIANVVGYFINKNMTFNSDAPISHLVGYLIYILFQMVFSTWIQGVFVSWLESFNNPFLSNTAMLISVILLGMVQTVIGYPILKYIVLRDRELRKLKKMYRQKNFSEDTPK